MTRTCWITGASGFIGDRLFRRLNASGFAAGGIDLAPPAPGRPGHAVVAALGLPALDQLAALTGLPDTVFHLAGGSAVGPSFDNPLEDFDRSVPPTATLVEWLRRHAPRARLVYASSAAVYGAGHDGAIREGAALNPYSPYGVHKAVCEQIIDGGRRLFGLDAVTARIFSVYGAGLRKQILFDGCRKLATTGHLGLGGTGLEARHFIECDDLVSALVSVMNHAEAGAVVNVAANDPLTMEDLAMALCGAWQAATGRACDFSFSGKARPGDPASLIADLGWMRAHCNWKPTPFADGVAAYVDWFRKDIAPELHAGPAAS
jgi:UDP-glucose 4-epimerase